MRDSVLRAAVVAAAAFYGTPSNSLAIGIINARVTRDADVNIRDRSA